MEYESKLIIVKKHKQSNKTSQCYAIGNLLISIVLLG